jgi:hypothetical protein
VCDWHCDKCSVWSIERAALHDASYTSDQRARLASFTVLCYTRRREKKKRVLRITPWSPQSAAYIWVQKASLHHGIEPRASRLIVERSDQQFSSTQLQHESTLLTSNTLHAQAVWGDWSIAQAHVGPKIETPALRYAGIMRAQPFSVCCTMLSRNVMVATLQSHVSLLML